MPSYDEIEAEVQQTLQGTHFEPTSLVNLAGGSVNWIFLATLSKPLDDGTSQILIKNGQKKMASRPDFDLPLLRGKIEADALRVLSNKLLSGPQDQTDGLQAAVRTPKLLHLVQAEESVTQIHEYLPNGIDLKSYMLKNFGGQSAPAAHEHARRVGVALGHWFRGLVDWSAAQAGGSYHKAVAQNTFAQDIKHMVNYAWLSERVSEFPDILDDVKDVLAEVENMSIQERKDEKGLYQIIHGDFWTGNIILPDRPLDAPAGGPIFVVDWESSQLGLPASDFGQMVAEMYALWLYKGIDGALSLMYGFIDAYMEGEAAADDFAFRSMIQTGAHLLCTTTTFPGWGSKEKVGEVAGVGRDIIVHAWKRNRAWFEQGELGRLFKPMARRV